MKQLLLLIFLAATTVSAGYAQDSAKTRLKNRQVQDLKLDENQGNQLRDINKSYMQSAQEIRKNEALSKEDRKKQLDALNTERAGRIKSVLSAEQFEKYQQNREKSMARADAYSEKRHKKEGRGKGRPSEEMKQSLGLTDAQGQELQNINKDFMARMKELKNNESLSKEQRHEQLKSLNEARKDKIKLALGNETFQKYHDWHRKEMGHHKAMRKRDELRKKKDTTDKL
ncbi:hypothetical protein EGT74_21780 [Chitinophaga lutea]|uniref:DUF4890 domain-containing protein n=1 Tax=Chitinophaga lutea TaxID=2488634 RepID=A0A3N4PWV3_9BACT|nr:hypothetical protein [Chitinophaga lutea]RPE09611.1 hypothetical protein EGT74_21780 [Chitinophaga lutea]